MCRCRWREALGAHLVAVSWATNSVSSPRAPAVPQAGQMVVVGTEERSRVERCLLRHALRGASGLVGRHAAQAPSRRPRPSARSASRRHRGREPVARGLAEAGGQSRSRRSLTIASPNAPISAGSSTSSPLCRCSISSNDARPALATIGRAFHIALVTPARSSCEALLTTTAARRWIAFTIASFSSGEVSGEAGEMNPRARRWRQSPPAFADLSEHGCGSWVIGDLAGSGPRAGARVARR